jgi:hypothetical protein
MTATMATMGMNFRVLACGAAALALTVMTALSIAEPTTGYVAGLRMTATPVVTVIAEEAATRLAQAGATVLLD